MSVTVRLSVVGKKNRPFYRIVACTTRSKRDGKFLEILGTYNPHVNPPILNLDKEKFSAWIKKGAMVSAGLRKIMK